MGRRYKGIALEPEATTEKSREKSITLYDGGSFILVWVFFGLPVGIIADYLWNLLVLWVSLPRLPWSADANPDTLNINKGKKLAYSFFVTLLGIAIDWAYLELTWDVDLGKRQLWVPLMNQPLQLVMLLVPMIMLWLVNFALSYSFLKLEKKQAVILGAIMAFFTAPWILPIVPYIVNWTV